MNTIDKAHSRSLHDPLFREVYGDRRNSKDLFRLALTPEEFDAFDWRTLQSMPTVYLIEELKEKRTDLLYSVKLKNTDQYLNVIFLLEHKSGQYSDLMQQLLEYQTRIYDKYPYPVVPVLFYHGREPEWAGRLEFHENLLGMTPKVKSLFGHNVLNFIARCVNLRKNEIKRSVSELRLDTKPILYIFDRIWEADVSTVEELFEFNLEKDDERREIFVWKAIDYICQFKPEITREMIMEIEREIMPREAMKSHFITGTLEKAAQQGLEQGLEQGREQGVRQIAHRMLQEGEQVENIQRWTGLSAEEIRSLRP